MDSITCELIILLSKVYIEIPKEIQEIETEEIEGNRFLIFI